MIFMGGGLGSLSSKKRRAQERVESAQSAAKSLFENKGYGSKLSLRPGLAIYVFAARTDSTVGTESKDLNKNGLRGHEGTLTEHITFLRFADDIKNDGSKPLIYRYEDPAGQVKEGNYGVGDSFFSVSDNGKKGFFHVIANTSDRPVLLMIRVEKKAADIRDLKR